MGLAIVGPEDVFSADVGVSEAEDVGEGGDGREVVLGPG